MTANQVDITVVEEADLDELIKEDLKATLPSLKDNPKANHYVDNQKLLTELSAHLEKVRNTPKGEPKPRLPEYVGGCILLIAQRLATRPNFMGYSFREEMIGDAIENCLLYIGNFNPEKSKNPFGYITQIVYYAFIRRIQKERKQQYIKAKKIHAAGITDEWVSHEEDDDGDYRNTYVEYLQQNSDFVKDFEEKLETKRKTRAKNEKKPKEGVEALLEDDGETE